jgi:tRNA pseudouridine55 synthase
VHVDGKRAYELARAGSDATLPARQIQIHRCELVSYAYPDAMLRVACGSGTYIRSLAHDLGGFLGCGAYLSGLRRTRVGEWKIEDAVVPNDVAWTKVLPLKDVLKALPGIELASGEAEGIRFGRTIERSVQPDTIGWFEGLPIAVLVPAGEGFARPRKVF